MNHDSRHPRPLKLAITIPHGYRAVIRHSSCLVISLLNASIHPLQLASKDSQPRANKHSEAEDRDVAAPHAGAGVLGARRRGDDGAAGGAGGGGSGLGQDVDLARGVGGHEQAALAVPREADGAEAGAGADAQVGVGDDVAERGGAVRRIDRLAGRGIESDSADAVADGVCLVNCGGLVQP